MSWNDPDREDTTTYKVVVNHEEQYSIWPEYKENPLGWREVGKVGPKDECLAYIKEVWTDMRPLSLRKKMEELARNPPPAPQPLDADRPSEKSLVDRLCEGEHRVEIGLRPEKSVNLLKDAIDRNYVHVKFTDTKGGTELGVRLDKDACNFSNADFEGGTGMIHVEGELTLDYVRVRCIADVDLATLEGTGHLTRAKASEAAGD
jgi:uncharacterized protein YbdZ (MbtH family)